ncbi:MAG: hypothetical protein JHC33_11240 [Ignisphaera sp.]|nr:hypothetical protein [Ignisphaera sp.]
MKNIQITKDNLIGLGFIDVNPYLSLKINKDISLQFHCYERDDDYITMCVSNDDFEDSLHYSLKHIKTIEQVKSLYNIMTNKILPNISTIEQLGLTDDQVHEIVLEWYTCGMCPDIFQNEKGEDIEDYLEI